MTRTLARIAAVVGALALGAPARAQSEVSCPSTPVLRSAAIDPAQAAFTIDTAERIGADGGVARVALPDALENRTGDAYVERRYQVPIDAPTQSLYLSSVFGHVRLALNGEVLLDTITEPLGPEPRASKRQRLLSLPPCLMRAQGNRVDITLRSQRYVGLSKVTLGGYDTLHDLRNQKTLWMSTAPAVAATIMAFSGLSMLLIWARRRSETIYLYFGLAALAWSVHTAWSVSATPWLPQPHQAVWWTSLYAFVVAMLVIFSLRIAGYRWSRVEHALRWGPALAPVLLYLGVALDALRSVDTALRLVMVLTAGAGLAAVAAVALRERRISSVLLLAAGIAAVGLGARDWLVFTFGEDLMPVQWAPFAGLPFVVLVTWFLIDRFVLSNETLERFNRELEQRVQAKSAELMTALDHMRAAKDWAEKANRSKTGFLAAASHDLRQPIHALGLYMSALRQRPLEPQTRDIVERMSRSSDALAELLDALLDVSRIDAGAIVPEVRPFDLGALLRRLGDEFAADAEARGLRLSLRIGAYGQATTALSDPRLVERIVRNLVANAVKYTRRGGVLVSCRARRGGAWDTGPGIAPEEQERVFEEFYQAGQPARDRRGGLGLGLSIVRRLAQLLRLPLALHSRPGRGTRVVLELPALENELCGVPTTAEREVVAQLVVAVIDDEAEVRDAMGTLLRSWGCVVLAGDDADAVLRGAREANAAPQAVIADLQLAGRREGIAEVARLREVFGAALPALLVSGDTAPERVRVMQSSGLPWLAKPVASARLRSWLAGARLTVRRKERMS